MSDKEDMDRLIREGLVVPDEVPLPPDDEEGHFYPLKTPATLPHLSMDPPSLAYDLRILDRFKAELVSHGVVGEESNGATLYLGITSRLLPKPVSLAVKGDSSSGKSFTTEQVVRFFPKSAVIVMSAMSEKALIYMKEDYAHRTLVLYEAVALREGVVDNMTAYFVRTLLSEGRVEYPVTVRDKQGGFTTKTIVKEGPTNMVLTTTATQLHGENETRLLSLPTDDSRAQTRKVLLRISDDVDPKGGPNLKEWLQLQEWLQTTNPWVAIPFARDLAHQIPPVAVRLRRDFSALLNLIKAHAILHQLNRERDPEGRIVASLEDYAVVRDLVAGLISDGVEATVAPTVREAVECVRELTAESPDGVQIKPIAEKLQLDKSAAARRLRLARDRGYLENLEDRRGRPARFVLDEPLPEEQVLLPRPEALASCHGATVVRRDEPEFPSQGGCGSVAAISEGYRGDEEEGDDLPSIPDSPFSRERQACAVCGAVTFYVGVDGDALCPRHKKDRGVS
ncbi:hypothetical protein BH20ACT21_BH20ACT21_25240 [soil metagenome]